MSHDPETTFLIQMAAVAVQGVPSDWVSSGPIIGALLNLADLPLCAASDAAAAQTLVALGARLPVASAPESCAQASIGLLVLEAPGEMSLEWQQVLVPGALVVTRSATGPVLDADGSLHVYFEIDAGMALDLCRGGQNDALRAFVEDASRRPGLTDAVARMALVLQGRNTHLLLAVDAAWDSKERLGGQHAATYGVLPDPGKQPAEPLDDPSRVSAGHMVRAARLARRLVFGWKAR
jgi:hypothetical protein